MSKVGKAFLPEMFEKNTIRENYIRLLDKNYNRFKKESAEKSKIEVT